MAPLVRKGGYYNFLMAVTIFFAVWGFVFTLISPDFRPLPIYWIGLTGALGYFWYAR